MNIPIIIETAISVIVLIILLSIISSSLFELIGNISRGRSKMLKEALTKVLNDPTLTSNHAELVYQHPEIKSMQKTEGESPSYLNPSIFSKALIDSVVKEYEDKKQEVKEEWINYQKLIKSQNLSTIDKFKLAVHDIGNSELGSLLKSLHANSEKTQDLVENIEHWYNNYMDRIGGWYKRKTHTKLMIMGILLAIAMNFDVIHITESIYQNSDVRDDLTAMAISTNAISQLDSTAPIDSLRKDISANYLKIRKSGIPIGWTSEIVSQLKDWKDYALMILGWFLTGILVSRGAPFWFNIMTKLINLRSSGTVSNAPKPKQ